MYTGNIFQTLRTLSKATEKFECFVQNYMTLFRLHFRHNIAPDIKHSEICLIIYLIYLFIYLNKETALCPDNPTVIFKTIATDIMGYSIFLQL